MTHLSKAIALVVEDDAIQRWFAVSMVEAAGFEAIEAGNADEAVRILESRKDIQNRLHRHQHAGKHGRHETRRLHSRPLAAGRDYPNLGGVRGEGCYASRARLVLSKTI